MSLTSRLVRARAVLAAVGLIALTPVRLASDQNRTQTFRAGTDLVEVDVVIRDKDGSPIRGLWPEDFTLLDRGKPVTVAAFEEIARQGRAHAVALPADDARGRRVEHDAGGQPPGGHRP